MFRCLLLGMAMVAMCGSCLAADFKDVPKDHWAAESVKMLADAGVVNGYPDGTFKGDKPVTRYELAVALDAMIRYIQASFKPVIPPDKSQSKAPVKSPAANLQAAGFLPQDSPLLKDTNEPVTADEVATALAAVSAKLIEKSVPAGQVTTEDQQPAEKPTSP